MVQVLLGNGLVFQPEMEYLENGGSLEQSQTIANHESPKTTKLYDRTREQLSFDEVERIKI